MAEAIDAFVRKTEVMDQSGSRHRGVLTGDDMAKWSASYDAPQTYDYHNYRVNKIRPWGQGPVFLQTLALLKGFDLAAMGPTSAQFVHTVVEAMKLAFADREAYYGDPDFVDVPIETLLSDAYNDERRKLIADTRVARAAPRPRRRLRGPGGAHPEGAARSLDHRPARSPAASRRSPPCARHAAATRCISMRSTASAT